MEEIGAISLCGEIDCVDLPFRVGQLVKIGTEHDISAVITAIVLRARGHVSYECSWMNGGERRIAVFEQVELRSKQEQFTRLGF